ncbi:hypothetical protein M2160_003060 [Streptomyces sp. SAI-117]|nr:hypothetical protein [Streptomyces sp. SAI-117]
MRRAPLQSPSLAVPRRPSPSLVGRSAGGPRSSSRRAGVPAGFPSAGGGLLLSCRAWSGRPCVGHRFSRRPSSAARPGGPRSSSRRAGSLRVFRRTDRARRRPADRVAVDLPPTAPSAAVRRSPAQPRSPCAPSRGAGGLPPGPGASDLPVGRPGSRCRLVGRGVADHPWMGHPPLGHPAAKAPRRPAAQPRHHARPPSHPLLTPLLPPLPRVNVSASAPVPSGSCGSGRRGRRRGCRRRASRPVWPGR